MELSVIGQLDDLGGAKAECPAETISKHDHVDLRN